MPNTASPSSNTQHPIPDTPSSVSYGGQAVIEGVMMRGPHYFAVACRRANGEIALTCEPVPPVLRPGWQKLPFLRGMFALVDAMTLGTKALFWAAKVAEADIPQAAKKGKQDKDAPVRHAEEVVGPALGTAAAALEPTAPRSSRVGDVAIGSAMITGLLFALGLIVVVPNLILEGVKATGIEARWQLGVIDGVVRIGIFLGYILIISRMHHVKRVFQYHGAEHKAINALEAGVPLTVGNAAAQTRLHPRCGTSFVFIVLILSTIAFSPFYGLPPYLRIPIHFLVALPVAGIAFELLRLAGKYRNNPLAAALSRPGMWAQLLTTREPDAEQLEVSIASLKATIAAETNEASGAPTPSASTTAVA